MREITIDLAAPLPVYDCGNCGEANAAQLKVDISSIKSEADFYVAVFKNALSETYCSKKYTPGSDEEYITVPLTQELTKTAKESFIIEAYATDENNELVMLRKSPVISLNFEGSISSDDAIAFDKEINGLYKELFDKTNELTNGLNTLNTQITVVNQATDTALAAAQTAAEVANAVLEAKNNGEFIGAQGEKGDKGDKGDTGAQGVQGEKGEKGDTGPQGEPGADGAAATVAVGTVTTGEPDTPASVTNSGTQNAAVLDFVIPQGVKGDKGDKGDTGPQGVQGEKGDKGDTGEKGTGIDDWVSALDLSAHSSKANALDILTLPAGGYIVTAGGYINVTGAGATEALDLSKGAYIAATSQGVSIVDGGSQYYLYSGIENSNSAYLPTYEEVEEMVAEKADEVKVSTNTGAGGNVNLRDKSDYRFEELSTLNLSLPTTVPDIFECNITFESGQTATILSYPADTIEFIGDECDTDGDFVPAAKTTYEINIKNLGYGRIRAFVKALEAQPVTVTPDYFVSARYNDWVRGAVTNGVFQDSSTRIRSGHHYYAPGTEVIIKIPSGFQMVVAFYSKSGNSYVFQGSLAGWQTESATFTIADGVNYAAFMYGLTNNTVAEPADGLEVEFLIKQPAQT